jgi:hypothetical protein
MRPISLYEFVRKAWTTIAVKRIHLHTDQCGYHLDNGTPMALLTVINKIEGAIHKKTTKNIIFWKIKRTFDSIPQKLQKLAWVRLGVPHNVAEWFVGLDDGEFSFLSSSLYHQQKNLRSPEELMKADTSFSPFQHLTYLVDREIGRGESASSLMWTALYDILLEWIEPANRQLHEAVTNLDYDQTDIDNTNTVSYADNLATVTGGPRAEYMQQLQATWLSAFCAFTGLVMHPAKIISIILGSTPRKYQQQFIIGPLTFEDKTDIIVHDHQWILISCEVDAKLSTVKYFGIHLDLQTRRKWPMRRHYKTSLIGYRICSS